MHRFVLLMALLTKVMAPTGNSTDAPETINPDCCTHPMDNTMRQNDMVYQTITPLKNIGKAPLKPRRKLKQVKGESPMLNYIFDSYATSNKHFHDKFRAPSFEGDVQLPVTALDADTGDTVYLDCRVSSLRDKMVSWLRVFENDNLELLTLNLDTHSADARYRVDLSGDNWRLELTDARVLDSGVYCCHVSTHPPMLKRVNLRVYPPEIVLSKEAFLETGETLSLKCSVEHLHPGTGSPVLIWYRGNSSKPLDELRGGVLIDTDQVALVTHLQVASLRAEDAGNYTCALEAPISMRATTRVHVLQGSSLAELQSGVKQTSAYISLLITSVLLVLSQTLLDIDHGIFR